MRVKYMINGDVVVATVGAASYFLDDDGCVTFTCQDLLGNLIQVHGLDMDLAKRWQLELFCEGKLDITEVGQPNEVTAVPTSGCRCNHG